jgi:hypothetical protein
MARRGSVPLLLATACVAAGFSALASGASAAPGEGDYAYAQFGVAAEYLLADFYARAAASKKFAGAELSALRRARFNAGEHVTAMGGMLTGGGQPLAAAADFSFSYPKDAFGSRVSIAKTGLAIEQAVVGAYLDAATSVTEPSFREVFARVLANDVEHLGLLTRIAGGRLEWNSFPEPLSLEAAGDAIERYFEG